MRKTVFFVFSSSFSVCKKKKRKNSFLFPNTNTNSKKKKKKVNPGTRAKIKFLRGREASSALAAAVPAHVLPHDLGGAAGSRDLPVEEAVAMMDRGEWPPARPLTAEEEEEEEERARSRKPLLLLRRSSGGGGGGLSRSVPATPRSPSSSSPLTPRSAASALLSAAKARLSSLGNRRRPPSLEGGQKRQQQGQQQGQQQQQQQLLLQAPPPSGGLFALLAAVLVGVLSALASVGLSAGALRIGGISGRRKKPAAAALEASSLPSPEGGQGPRPLSPSSIKMASRNSLRPLFRLTAVPALTLAPLRRMLSSSSSSRGSSRASSRPASAAESFSSSSEPLTPLTPPAPAAPASLLSANAAEADAADAAAWIPPRGTFASRSEWLLYRGSAGAAGGRGEDEAAVVLHEMTMMS